MSAGGVVDRRGGGESRGRDGSQNAAPRTDEQRETRSRGSYDRGTGTEANRGTWNRADASSTTNIDRERQREIAADSYRNGGRNDSRNDGYRNGNHNNDGYRNGNRNDGYRGGNHNDGYRGGNNRQPYYTRGRVTRIDPWNGGFRIYVAGAPFPFFVSDSYYRRNHWRVGIEIALGGYYNPLGYYDYYDGAYDSRGYSTGALRGTVESVDFRRDTFVVRNDATGSFVTVASRSRRDEVRPGDYVEIYGDWTRSGIFDAYRVDLLDSYRR